MPSGFLCKEVTEVAGNFGQRGFSGEIGAEIRHVGGEAREVINTQFSFQNSAGKEGEGWGCELKSIFPLFQDGETGEFPGGPVVRAPSSHC